MYNQANKGKKKTPPKRQKKQRVILNEMHTDMINSCLITANGRQPNKRRGEGDLHYIDVKQTLSPTSSGTILSSLVPAPQGITVSSRIGDTVYLHDMFINYSLNAANSDVVSMTRVIIFQWHPTNALVAPVVNDILDTTDIYSMYLFQFSAQFTILYDRLHFSSGTAASPASSANQGYFGRISLAKARKKIQYSKSSTLGANELFMLIISDSTIAPFPSYIGNTRVFFTLE